MKNTIKNKEKFFAQYWGQKVLSEWGESLVQVNGKLDRVYDISEMYLKLKPLSKISKKDLKAIDFKNIGDKKVSFNFTSYSNAWSSSCGNYGWLLLHHYDYLRSKGYALPWNGLSVEKMVEFGWIKLK